MYLKKLAEIITNVILKKYKAEKVEVFSLAKKEIEKNKKLLSLIEEGKSIEEILRTKIFKDISHKISQVVYHQLRRYKKNEDKWGEIAEDLKIAIMRKEEEKIFLLAHQMAKLHVSTQERIESEDYFYKQLFSIIGSPQSIIDIGCGLQPLVFPFTKQKELKNYLAIDNDKKVIEILNNFRSTLREVDLITQAWNLKDGWNKIPFPNNEKQFDLGLMLKIVPVIARQEREALKIRAVAPARVWVITGSKKALVKNKDIERRERRIINDFIKLSGKKIIGEFETDSEFCLVVE